MHIVSLALGGCLRGEPVAYGITEDTGGHIAYILGEMRALAAHPGISCAEIITRRFDAPELGAVHNERREVLGDNLMITRIDSGDRRYLAKEALASDRAAFIRALVADLRQRERLPDLIHAHFADAADVAAHVQRELGIPYVYTAHSLGLDKRDASGCACPELDDRIAEEDRAIAGAAAIVGSSRDECERQLLGYRSARVDQIHRIVPGTAPPSSNERLRERASALIEPFLRDPSKPIVLAIARAVRKKNLSALVDAFGGSANLRERANLVILAGQRDASDAGEAEQVAVVSDILARIDRHDLYGSVAYPKTHDGEDVAGLYDLAARSGGVFVNPALFEPYGLTVVEAASYGLPVVATAIGGPIDTVNELQHGLIADPRDTGAIAGAIEALLSDRALWQRCSANGKTRSACRDWASYAEHFVKLAQQITKTRLPAIARTGPAVTSLLVSDIDYTLTGCADGVERLRRFLARRGNFAFAVATGRSIVEARRIHRKWNLPEPVAWITSVGSEIYWTTGDGLLRDRSFPVLAHARWEAGSIETLIARQGAMTPQPAYEQREFKRSYFYTDPAQVEQVRTAISEKGLPARVIASHDRFLDILPTSAGKAAAMDHVAGVLRIDKSRVFAAGDSGNDEDMLTACANAIMVANHRPEIAALSKRKNVYLARHRHAAGVVEGLTAHTGSIADYPRDTQKRKRA